MTTADATQAFRNGQMDEDTYAAIVALNPPLGATPPSAAKLAELRRYKDER